MALCCSKVPDGRSRWPLRILADELVELKNVDTISLTRNRVPRFKK